MRRDKPMDERDSGWMLYSGLETEEQLADPKFFAVVPLARLLELDPSLRPLVDSPPGSAWERTPETEEWLPVDDD
jgi:hypothetical protein